MGSGMWGCRLTGQPSCLHQASRPRHPARQSPMGSLALFAAAMLASASRAALVERAASLRGSARDEDVAPHGLIMRRLDDRSQWQRQGGECALGRWRPGERTVGVVASDLREPGKRACGRVARRSRPCSVRRERPPESKRPRRSRQILPTSKSWWHQEPASPH